VFSTWLYTGTSAIQTITNGIDLSTKGGLVWIKQRSGSQDHTIFDTARGVNNYLRSNSTGAQNPGGAYSDLLTAYNTTGFSLGADASTAGFVNGSGSTYVSWTFREQPKFFDVVTYTGNGVAGRALPHNLGSIPGCVFVKLTSSAGSDWMVWHRGSGTPFFLILNSSQASLTSTYNASTAFMTQAPDANNIYIKNVGFDAASANADGFTYVAYIFAHDAGGFGNAGTDNVISCGSFTTDGTGNATVTLGYEPQWVLIRRTDSVADWRILDTMRLWSETSTVALRPNSTGGDLPLSNGNTKPKATGFTTSGDFGTSSTCIYIAIRRGPMKTPTVGTSVYNGIAYTGDGVNNRFLDNQFVTDLIIDSNRSASNIDQWVIDRLRGAKQLLVTRATNAEQTASTNFYVNGFDSNNGVFLGSGGLNGSAATYIQWAFRRAPGFFDVVNFEVAGTTLDTVEPHNLTVVPELCIFKPRSQIKEWIVWHKDFGTTQWAILNTSAAAGNGSPGTMPVQTATTFGVNSTGFGFTSFLPCIAYLFASCPGVSKVGSYTGTAATLTVNCGFTTGARFVLIKRTDSTGDWYVWDSARGIVAGNDPYILLNSSAAEVTGTNYVDTDTTGFKVTAAAPAGLNASGGTYIFLAIA
jgi:hypothetical protein